MNTFWLLAALSLQRGVLAGALLAGAVALAAVAVHLKSKEPDRAAPELPPQPRALGTGTPKGRDSSGVEGSPEDTALDFVEFDPTHPGPADELVSRVSADIQSFEVGDHHAQDWSAGHDQEIVGAEVITDGRDNSADPYDGMAGDTSTEELICPDEPAELIEQEVFSQADPLGHTPDEPVMAETKDPVPSPDGPERLTSVELVHVPKVVQPPTGRELRRAERARKKLERQQRKAARAQLKSAEQPLSSPAEAGSDLTDFDLPEPLPVRT